MAKSIIFDLDGTLTDSGPGIMRSVKYALDQMGIDFDDMTKLRSCVGPPLSQSFPHLGVPEDRVEEAIDHFRERYISIGVDENEPYEGIHEALEALKEAGFPLYVATSKPELMADHVLRRFKLTGYFTGICGATMSTERETKHDVLAYLLDTYQLEDPVMVGDTIYDVDGAAVFNIPCLGVKWGYGSGPDMLDHGAQALVSDMEELKAYFLDMGRKENSQTKDE